jgi:hypothetical protein
MGRGVNDERERVAAVQPLYVRIYRYVAPRADAGGFRWIHTTFFHFHFSVSFQLKWKLGHSGHRHQIGFLSDSDLEKILVVSNEKVENPGFL